VEVLRLREAARFGERVPSLPLPLDLLLALKNIGSKPLRCIQSLTCCLPDSINQSIKGAEILVPWTLVECSQCTSKLEVVEETRCGCEGRVESEMALLRSTSSTLLHHRAINQPHNCLSKAVVHRRGGKRLVIVRPRRRLVVQVAELYVRPIQETVVARSSTNGLRFQWCVRCSPSQPTQQPATPGHNTRTRLPVQQ
jgi:hypothetical protein